MKKEINKAVINSIYGSSVSLIETVKKQEQIKKKKIALEVAHLIIQIFYSMFSLIGSALSGIGFYFLVSSISDVSIYKKIFASFIIACVYGFYSTVAYLCTIEISYKEDLEKLNNELSANQ